MIYVSLDPEGLQRVITGLSNYGTKARECRESVKNTNDRNDSPTDLAHSLVTTLYTILFILSMLIL